VVSADHRQLRDLFTAEASDPAVDTSVEADSLRIELPAASAEEGMAR
jgi:hypothetical protein